MVSSYLRPVLPPWLDYNLLGGKVQSWFAFEAARAQLGLTEYELNGLPHHITVNSG